ncbi:multidrug efflux RND transporter permease subunit [Oxalobacter aliiformigenes]|uniref:multidrug efflux RND transporter permease subunit n=1 Tax=Oxalobacter aliiformigenes TaxID=2946593 RepID=UPI0022AF4AFC|nr:multidrug efflux RND transporter permease subunit [Oxalobacter aliiformigenes]MCZ4065969.1 multidrug efflux RND transporter permease subunit [Oxalobacter aliiformigenes]WAW00331.1 multidrug efflux RND transporter permease subunit [Oxalobacter aliiformigenes]
MKFSEIFIRRPVATVLVTLAILLAGIVAFNCLSVSPLPQVDFPTIRVRAQLPGASPETMASTVATPLERSLGRIAGITEITSTSTLGQTEITLQFDLDRDIDGAARDVQSAINAARALLPSGLISNPTYRKINPADSPIMILSMTSESLTRGQMYDAADTIVAQKLMQLEGVGDVFVGGGSQPAVRVELNPDQLSSYGISMESIRNIIKNTNVSRPKGFVGNDTRQWKIEANDKVQKAKDYIPLIVHHSNGKTIRLSDIADVTDSVQDVRNMGMVNGEPCIMIIIFREPGANIIETVDRIRDAIPNLSASIPEAIDVNVVMDRTPTIRASLADVEFTLIISIALVILVVFVFLRNFRATAISAISVPVSLVGTFVVMYLAGFSLNNLSLMALTIATGFVVDDTIVVLENIMRHIEAGMKPFDAAMQGAKEVGFTVMSISISLIAVFIPILLMGGIIGRLFREFAVTLSATILVSLFISLTTTPMLCALWLKRERKTTEPGRMNRLFNASERFFSGMQATYARTLKWAISHRRITLLALLATICFNIFLYIVVPKGFFPQQDTGQMFGVIRADQSISFTAMQEKMNTFMAKIKEDPAINQVMGYTASTQSNTARMFISLKPLSERDASADEVIGRLRGKLASEPGATLFLQSVQDIRMGGRSSNAQYQYTLQGDDLDELREWTPKVFRALAKLPILADLNTDQELKGRQTMLTFDRDAMSRLGLTQQQVDDVLYDAFGQRQISTIYNELNQYKVVMEVAPQYWQNPETLNNIYIQTPDAGMTRLSAIARWEPVNTSLSVNHQGQFAASTLSFNLPPNNSLSDATVAIERTLADIGIPSSIVGSFQGTAKTFQESLSNQPLLIVLALVAVYIVLGILYESFIHPVTIISTLPSAGVGALLALILAGSEFSIIALIGVLLLIGIVKKNAIMMIDFALVAEREEGLTPENAIYQACLLRFRPIMMTTTAALFGALPLALGHGDGAELRIPLGISIVGGLILSQLLTLYTTPIVYLYLDRFRKRTAEKKGGEKKETV